MIQFQLLPRRALINKLADVGTQFGAQKRSDIISRNSRVFHLINHLPPALHVVDEDEEKLMKLTMVIGGRLSTVQ